MAMFGRRIRANTQPTIPLMQELQSGKAQPDVKVGGTEQVRSGSGFRGAFFRKSIPRTLQILGATLQQIENPQGQLDAFSANEADQQRQAAVEAAQARTGKIEDDQRAQLEQAISSLPQDQQVWARANPEAFMRAFMQAQMDQRNNGWNVGQGYSHAFRTDPNGHVILGDALPLRPRAPNMGYVMPGDVDEWDYSNE